MRKYKIVRFNKGEVFPVETGRCNLDFDEAQKIVTADDRFEVVDKNGYIVAFDAITTDVDK
jgi:hypothetical protein